MLKSIHTLELTVVVSLGLASMAQGGQFYTVAVAGQSMPGYTNETFGTFFSNPGVGTDGSDVVFEGASSIDGTDKGIYDFNIATQSLTPIALVNGNTNNKAPDGSSYSSVGQPTVNNGLVSFYGNIDGGSSSGIFTAPTSGASTSALAVYGSNQPGTSNTFNTFNNYTGQSGSSVIFEGGSNSAGYNGVYISTSGSSPSRIIDSSSSMPGSGTTFGGFQDANISGNTVAFLASANNLSTGVYWDGIYTTNTSGGSPTTIALGVVNGSATGSTAPGGSNTFSSIYYPVTDGSHVAFYGSFANQINSGGLYMYNADGSGGTPIVTNSTPIPGGGGENFAAYISSTYSLSNGVLAFNGSSSDGSVEGIFAYENGAIVPIITNEAGSDTIPGYPGYTVQSAFLVGASPSTANGIEDYAFEAVLSNGTPGDNITGIFVDPVAVPEPCALGLLGMSSLLVLRRRRQASGL
jgi:hypothetical protein